METQEKTKNYLDEIAEYLEYNISSLDKALKNNEITEDFYRKAKDVLESSKWQKEVCRQYGKRLISIFDLPEDKDPEQLGIDMCKLIREEFELTKDGLFDDDDGHENIYFNKRDLLYIDRYHCSDLYNCNKIFSLFEKEMRLIDYCYIDSDDIIDIYRMIWKNILQENN